MVMDHSLIPRASSLSSRPYIQVRDYVSTPIKQKYICDINVLSWGLFSEYFGLQKKLISKGEMISLS